MSEEKEKNNSRREFLKKAAPLAGAAVLGATALAGCAGPTGAVGPIGPQGPVGPQGPEGLKGDQGRAGQDGLAAARPWKQLALPKGVITCDPMICGGCRSCEGVCSMIHEGVYSPELSRIHILKEWTMYNIEVDYQPIICLQCADAPCVQNCPMNAIKVDEQTGARVVNQQFCIGCHVCEKSCPFTPSRVSFNKDNKAFKCDLCGGDPECVKSCPMGALKYVQYEDGVRVDSTDYYENLGGA